MNKKNNEINFFKSFERKSNDLSSLEQAGNK